MNAQDPTEEALGTVEECSKVSSPKKEDSTARKRRRSSILGLKEAGHRESNDDFVKLLKTSPDDTKAGPVNQQGSSHCEHFHRRSWMQSFVDSTLRKIREHVSPHTHMVVV